MGYTIQETTVTDFIGNYIHSVNVIKGSLYSRVYSSVEMTEEELVASVPFSPPKEGIQVYFTSCFRKFKAGYSSI